MRSYVQAASRSWVSEGGLYRLNVEVLGHNDRRPRGNLFRPQPQGGQCAFVDRLFAKYDVEEQTYGMLLDPRETLKTTGCVVGGVLQFLIDHRDGAVLIDGHKHALAKERLSGIVGHLESNKRFKELYGDWSIGAKEWNTTALRFKERVDGALEPSIDTSGEDQSKTGGHYDLIIADDLVNEKNSDSMLLREATKRHIATLYPLLKKGGVLLVVGTRWHYDDAYGYILKNNEMEAKRAEELGIEPEFAYETFIHSAINADGTLYAPEILSYKRLEFLRRNMPRSLFACNYLNVPIEEEDKTFPSSGMCWFEAQYGHSAQYGNYLEFADGSRSAVNTYFLWDTAGLVENPTEGASAHGFVILAVDANDEWYVLEMEDYRGKPTDVVNRALYLTIEYRPKIVSGEFNGVSAKWKDHYVEALRKRSVRIPGMEIARFIPTRNKDLRIETALEPRYRRGGIHIRVGLETASAQFGEFPKRNQKDSLDALAQGDTVAKAPAAVELDPEMMDFPVGEDEDEDSGPTNVGVIKRAGAWTGTSTPVPIGGFPSWH